MITAEDVGRKVGVSAATVSRAFSKRGYVSKETRAAVLSAAETLGYLPNAMARGLKTQRSGFIAFIMPEVLDPYFFATLSRGIAEIASRHGFQLLVGNTDEQPTREQSLVELMVAHAVEGMIITPSSGSARSLESLSIRDIPTVLVDRVIAGFNADTVRSHDREGARLLVNHLAALGHRRIALVNGDPSTSVAAERDAGFREAMLRAGLPFDERLVSRGPWRIEDAEWRVDELLRSRHDVTAVIAANLYMAIGALRSFRRHGIRVPEDKALVSFNDLPLAADIDPFLTVLRQPVETMGQIAMTLLLERIQKNFDGPPREVILPPQLIIRRSCGSPLPADRAVHRDRSLNNKRAAP